MDRPLVVCPLRFEQAELRRHGVARRAELTCCGVGAAAVRAWAERTDAAAGSGGVILAGIAGGLRPGASAGAGYVASMIVGETGRRWSPSLRAPPALPAAIIVQASTVLATPASKRDARERSGADLVDMESAAFAEIATERGWRWAVVRGVSDDDATDLPLDIDGWMDGRGRLRPVPIILALARCPALLPALLRVRADGKRSLRSAAEIVNRLLDGTERPPVP